MILKLDLSGSSAEVATSEEDTLVDHVDGSETFHREKM